MWARLEHTFQFGCCATSGTDSQHLKEASDGTLRYYWEKYAGTCLLSELHK